MSLILFIFLLKNKKPTTLLWHFNKSMSPLSHNVKNISKVEGDFQF